MERFLEPELLDALPGNDSRAQGSRRDLRRINAWMGNARLVAAWLAGPARLSPPQRLVDLGAGDGAFLLRLASRLPMLGAGTELVLVDRCGVVDEFVLAKLRARGFHPQVAQTDAWDWIRATPGSSGTWVLANLFFHHFSTEHLRTAFAWLAERADLCCVCEPRRAAWPLLASRFLGFLGANAVTRHDAVASVRAGFAGQELSALWPASASWRLHEQRAGLFSHLFLAERRAGPTPIQP